MCPSPRLGFHCSDRSTGEIHKRYKKVLLPAFGIPEAKEFLPTFTHVVTRVGDIPPYPIRPAYSLFQLADRWTNELVDKDSAEVINVADGLMRVTLDACVPYLLSPDRISYVPSQYWIRHVALAFDVDKHAHSNNYPQPLLIMTSGR